jgi:hypothetical protein
MPVDKPKPGETQDEYLKYCIPAEIKEGYERDQAVAICINTFEKEQNMKAIKASRDFRDEFMKHIPSNKSIK